MGSTDGCLLVVVLDVHPHLALHENNTQTYLSSAVAFANLHLATNSKNRLAFIAANHATTTFLYPDSSELKSDRQRDGRLELLDNVNQMILDKLKDFMDVNNKGDQMESLISGALGRALLYIKRIQNQDQITGKINARILVLKVSSSTGGQYLNYINAYLTAQKINTAIDVCVIGSSCGLLQQGAHITGGYYQSLPDMSNLLQTLLMIYAPDVKLRKVFNVPPQDTVDFRAACFCHRTLIDSGNVCSNCLSVYCKAVPLCATCNVIFQVDRPLVKLPRKKK